MGNTSSQYRLPTELKAEIFDLACEDYREHVRIEMEAQEHAHITEVVVVHHERYEHIITPGTLSLVCKLWRDIAYHTPCMWDTVLVKMDDLVDDDDSEHSEDSNLEHRISEASTKLQKWLDRSGNCPLTVKIRGPELLHKPLLECWRRWKSIDISCLEDRPELYSMLERIMKLPPPLLESFICRPNRHCCTLTGDVQQHPVLSLNSARTVTQLALFRNLPISVRPSQIKVCRWYWGSPVDIIAQMTRREMANLRDCAIIHPRPDFPGQPTVHRLSQLENLTLRSLWTHNYNYLLSSLELPALRRFTFSTDGDPTVFTRTATVDALGHIYRFILRSSSPFLQVLDLNISAAHFQGDILLNILRLSPSLEHLKLALRRFRGFKSRLPYIERRQQDPVVLRNLISYYIDISELDCDSDRNATLIKYLTVPVLKSFQIALPVRKQGKTNPVSKYAYSAALNLVLRSSCALTTLKINTETNISSDGLTDFLKSVPTLECLHLVGQNYERNSLQKLKFEIPRSLFVLLLPQPQTSTGGSYLPRLSELSCEGILCANMDGILSALEYRWRRDGSGGMQRLLRVRIYTVGVSELMDERTSQRLSELQMQGMDVKFGESFPIGKDVASVRY